MDVYLESSNNAIIQVFSEFDMFLYVISHTCSTNLYLQNVINDSRRIHIRALINFFNNSGKKSDDLFSCQFLTHDHSAELSISNHTEVVNFIIKYTAHITKTRGAMRNTRIIDTWFIDISKELVTRINRFIRFLDSDINSKYEKEYQHEHAQKIKSSVLSKVISIAIKEALEGTMVEL